MKKTLNIIVTLLFFFNFFSILAQDKTSVYVSAHPDDWQLFMNPNVYQSVKNPNKKVVIIHTTAGDAGSGTGNNNFFLAREEGSLRALRFMSNTFTSGAGLGTNMNETIVTINGHQILKYTYRNIVAYFLRLPDGNIDGSGFSLHNYKNLQKLYNRTISNISAIDNSTTYNSLSDLKNTLRLIVETESGNLDNIEFNLPDDDDTINPDDHSDHVYSSEVMQDVADEIGNITINLYVDYDSGTREQNIFNDDFLVSAGTWAVTTSGISDHSHHSTWDSGHNIWIGKQYFRTLGGIHTIAFTNTEVSVKENTSAGFARFNVTLTGDINENVTVDYTTIEDTALNPGDYSTKSGTITFTPTNKSFDIDVPITNDATLEPQEAYTVVLSNIVSNLEVEFFNGAPTITANGIINDDDDNTINLALNKPTTASSFEDEHYSSLAVDNDFSLESWWGANPYAQWWQVDLLDVYDINKIIVTNYYDGTRYYQYDIEGSLDGVNWISIKDFNNNTTPATDLGNTFNIKKTSARFLRVNMNFNSANVGVHIVEFEAYGELTDTGIAFTKTKVIVDENTPAGFARFNVTLTGNISENVTVDYTTAEGTALSPIDYSTTSGTITFTSTDKSFDIDVPIIDDATLEPKEDYTIILSNIVSNLGIEFVNGGSTNTAKGIINDNDNNSSNIAFTNTEVSVDENTPAGFARFNVTLTGDISENVTVDYTTTEETAINPSDYSTTTGTITFTPTNKSFDIDVPITDDTEIEPQESFSLVLSNIVSNLGIGFINGNPTLTANGIINDNDSNSSNITFTNTEVIVDENISAGFARFNVTLTGDINENVTVDYTTAKGTAINSSDYSTTAGTITFTPINKSFDIDVPIIDDVTLEPQEMYTVVLSNIVGIGTGFTNGVTSIAANGIINDNDSNTSNIAFTNTEVIVEENISGGFARFNVTLSGDISENVKVDYTTAEGTALNSVDFTNTAGTITFTPTNKSFDIDVPITDDSTTEPQETYTVILTNIVSNFDIGFANENPTLTANGIINDDDTNVSNLALNKPTTASSFEDDRFSSLAVDNDFSLSSWWGANPYAQWWQVDLQDAYDLSKIVVTNYYDGTRYYQYDIEGSLDGINWTDIADFNSNTTPATNQGNTFNITNTSARYLRVNMNFNSANVGVHIVEFEAYGEFLTSKVSTSKVSTSNQVENIKKLNDLLVYPNPINKGDSITIELDDTTIKGTVLLEVFDIKGSSIFSKKIEQNNTNSEKSIKLNTSTLSRGWNIISLTIGGKVFRKKVLIK